MTDDQKDDAGKLAATIIELLAGIDGAVCVSALAKASAAYHVMCQPADRLPAAASLFHMLFDANVREISAAYERDKQ